MMSDQEAPYEIDRHMDNFMQYMKTIKTKGTEPYPELQFQTATKFCLCLVSDFNSNLISNSQIRNYAAKHLKSSNYTFP